MRASRVLTCLLALAVSGTAWAADPVFPPGSRIGLVPPADMVASKGLAGFNNPKLGTAIATIEMPVEAYPSISASFTPEALKAQGFTLRSRDTVKIGSGEALLISGEQNEGGRAVPKSLLLASDAGMTALVIAQAPPGVPAATEAELVAALKTVVFRAPLSIEDQLASLPFSLRELAGFHPVRVMAGNSLLLTEGPNDAVREAEQPVLIVAQSFAPAPANTPELRDVFARQLLGANTMLTDATIERSQGFRQGGADWHEIVAKAKDARSSTPVVVMQTIRFAPDGYLRMVGIVRAEDRDKAMPQMRKVVDAVTPK